jgi:hypothetical protein
MSLVCFVQLQLSSMRRLDRAKETNSLFLLPAKGISVGSLLLVNLVVLIIEQHYSVTHLNYGNYVRFDVAYI